MLGGLLVKPTIVEPAQDGVAMVWTGVGVAVGVSVGVAVGVSVGVAVGVRVSVGVIVKVKVEVGVKVGLDEAGVKVGTRVAPAAQVLIQAVIMPCPVVETVLPKGKALGMLPVPITWRAAEPLTESK